jgi:DNA-binding Lrp family transcriptional regulator
MIELSKHERKVLTLLEEDCRMPSSKIAKTLRLSPLGVIKIIERMKKEGIITKFNSKVNYSKVGYEVYPVHIKLKRMDDEIINKIKQKLSTQFTWHSFCEGEYDLMLSFKVLTKKDKYAMDKILNELSPYIAEKEICIVLEAFEIGKTFDIDKKSKMFTTFSENADRIELEAEEMQMIELIKSNSRKNIVELAKELNTTARVAGLRLRSLERKEVISGYKTKINTSLLGHQPCIALISLDKYDEKEMKKLLTYCQMKDGINYVVREIGKYDLELNIHAKTLAHFYEIIDDIRQTFAFVKKITTLIIKETPNNL